jgi:hypothetical protein
MRQTRFTARTLAPTAFAAFGKKRIKDLACQSLEAIEK